MVETHEPCVSLKGLNLVVGKEEIKGIYESGKGWVEEGRTDYGRQNEMKGNDIPRVLLPASQHLAPAWTTGIRPFATSLGTGRIPGETE